MIRSREGNAEETSVHSPLRTCPGFELLSNPSRLSRTRLHAVHVILAGLRVVSDRLDRRCGNPSVKMDLLACPLISCSPGRGTGHQATEQRARAFRRGRPE